MRSIWLALAVALLPAMAQAQGEGLGLGLIVGEPTGICLKQWTGHRTALAAGLAWSFADDAALHVHGDYLVHTRDHGDRGSHRSPFYYGLGVRLKAREDDTWLGLRVPLGLAFFVDEAPLDFFVEAAPLMDLAPSTEFRINAAIGVRYYFGR